MKLLLSITWLLFVPQQSTRRDLQTPDSAGRMEFGLSKKATVESSLLAVGTVAPDWTLMDSDGVEKKLSDYRGKYVVMDFWATWCAPCVKAIPILEEFHQQHPDVVLIGVNIMEKVDLASYKKRKKITYEFVQADEKTAKRYQVEILPTVYVIDKEGRILYAKAGNGDDEKAGLISLMNSVSR